MSDNLTLDDLPQPEREEGVAPDSLSVDGDNPNEQDDATFGLLVDNIRSKGWIGNAIVADTDGLIADGEHRWRAAQEVGLSEVPVKFYDLSDAERRLWRQELNKISGEHDRKRDALEYDQLLDAGKSDEVDALVNAADEDLDELLAEIRVDRSSTPFYEYDVEHSVYFEDCVEGMAERLDDDSVDCVITDPPYGIDFDGSYGGGAIKGDADGDATLELLDAALSESRRALKPDGHAYVHWTPRELPAAFAVLKSHFKSVQLLVWKKKYSNLAAVLENHNYGYNYEVVFYCVLDSPRPLNGSITQCTDVLEYTSPTKERGNTDPHHPTEKPIGLTTELLENSTAKGDTVLDPFMGSGTTAVAAIQNDRDYVGFEIDAENYRPVIERRIGEAKRQMESSQNSSEDADSTVADD
jgi:DNA modification methylase